MQIYVINVLLQLIQLIDPFLPRKHWTKTRYLASTRRHVMISWLQQLSENDEL